MRTCQNKLRAGFFGLGCLAALMLCVGSAEAQAPTAEFRVNTGTAALGAGQPVDTVPGVMYLFDSDLFIVNLDLGAGAVFAGDFIIGLNVGVRLTEDTDADQTSYDLRLGPYLRYAPGLVHRYSGFFIEGYVSGGVRHVDGVDDSFTFNGGTWAGYQVFLGFGAVLSLGAFIEYFHAENAGTDNNDEGVVGFRIGLSVFP